MRASDCKPVRARSEARHEDRRVKRVGEPRAFRRVWASSPPCRAPCHLVGDPLAVDLGRSAPPRVRPRRGGPAAPDLLRAPGAALPRDLPFGDRIGRRRLLHRFRLAGRPAAPVGLRSAAPGCACVSKKPPPSRVATKALPSMRKTRRCIDRRATCASVAGKNAQPHAFAASTCSWVRSTRLLPWAARMGPDAAPHAVAAEDGPHPVSEARPPGRR